MGERPMLAVLFSDLPLLLFLPLRVRGIPVLCEQWRWTKSDWSGCTLRYVHGIPLAPNWSTGTVRAARNHRFAIFGILCTWSTCKNRLAHRLIRKPVIHYRVSKWPVGCGTFRPLSTPKIMALGLPMNPVSVKRDDGHLEWSSGMTGWMFFGYFQWIIVRTCAMCRPVSVNITFLEYQCGRVHWCFSKCTLNKSAKWVLCWKQKSTFLIPCYL